MLKGPELCNTNGTTATEIGATIAAVGLQQQQKEKQQQQLLLPSAITTNWKPEKPLAKYEKRPGGEKS